MGSGVSHMSSDLTEGQKLELNQMMRKEMYKNFRGKNEEQIREYMRAAYERHCATIRANGPKPVNLMGGKTFVKMGIPEKTQPRERRPSYQEGEYPQSRGSSRAGSRDARAASRSASRNASRRASFTNWRGESRSGSMGASASQAAKGTSAAFNFEDREDTWDSVTQQPTCTVCNVAFRTMDALERHFKHSAEHIKQHHRMSQHQSVIDARAAAGLPPVITTTVDGAGEEKSYCNICELHLDGRDRTDKHIRFSLLHAKQCAAALGEEFVDDCNTKPLLEQGVKDEEPEIPPESDFTKINLLYSGTKIYCRTRESIDFDIYHHVAAGAVEVVGHTAGPAGATELVNRLYLDYGTVLKCIEPTVVDTVQARVNEAREREKSLSKSLPLQPPTTGPKRKKSIVPSDLITAPAPTVMTSVYDPPTKAAPAPAASTVPADVLMSITEEAIEQIKQETFVTFILNRLQLQRFDASGAAVCTDLMSPSAITRSTPGIYLTRLTCDEYDRSPVIDTTSTPSSSPTTSDPAGTMGAGSSSQAAKPLKPLTLHPKLMKVKVIKRRRTLTEEISGGIEQLAVDHEKLESAMVLAEDLESRVFSGKLVGYEEASREHRRASTGVNDIGGSIRGGEMTRSSTSGTLRSIAKSTTSFNQPTAGMSPKALEGLPASAFKFASPRPDNGNPPSGKQLQDSADDLELSVASTNVGDFDDHLATSTDTITM